MSLENGLPVQRIRMIYKRGQELRYVSHLDMQLVWERTFRRARLPMAYSQGFSPHPRLHMASALPLGFLSRCELMDVWLEQVIEPGELQARAQAAAPPGLLIEHAEEVAFNAPALQTQVVTAVYTAKALDRQDEHKLKEATAQLLAADSLPRERRGKAYDLRPLIEILEVQAAEDGPKLYMSLAAREGATGRPEEVLAAMGLEPAEFRVERMQLILQL